MSTEACAPIRLAAPVRADARALLARGARGVAAEDLTEAGRVALARAAKAIVRVYPEVLPRLGRRR